jgi:hypothetical protein
MMKTRLIYAAFVSVLATSCISQQTTKTDCGNLICTKEFVSIPVKIISTNGTSVSFKSYKVIDIATGKSVSSKDLDTKDPNIIVIADDSHLKKFAGGKGQALQLQIKKTDDSILKVDYKIAGGKCACHVAKIEGPDEVNINP